MKNQLSRAVALLSAVFLLSGCAAYAVAPVTGFVYSDTKFGINATSNEGSSKVGEAFSESYLGFVAIGDASIEAAMKNGGITKVQHVDYHTYSVLGLYAKFTVIVYGE